MIIGENSQTQGLNYININNHVPLVYKPVWVKIRRLYACITTTGNESWREVVKKENTAPKHKVVICSGPHGEICGTMYKSDGRAIPEHTRGDVEHVMEDLQQKLILEKDYKDVTLEVTSVGGAMMKSTNSIRRRTERYLSDGATAVIWAWCYSFYTMNTLMMISPTEMESQMRMRSESKRNLTLTVEEVVNRDFFWV